MFKNILIFLMGIFGLLVFVNAISHLIMGHEWTILEYQKVIFIYLTNWSFISGKEFK